MAAVSEAQRSAPRFKPFISPAGAAKHGDGTSREKR
jgi:hypothetical protein